MTNEAKDAAVASVHDTDRQWRWVAVVVCFIGLVTLFHSMIDAPLSTLT